MTPYCVCDLFLQQTQTIAHHQQARVYVGEHGHPHGGVAREGHTLNTALTFKMWAMFCLRMRDVAGGRRLICANGKTGGVRQSLSA